MNNWDQAQQQPAHHHHHHHHHSQQQQQQPAYPQRSQSVSIPSSQFAGSSQSQQQQYPQGEYGQQPNYDRRQPPSAYPIPPLQINPSTFHQSDAPLNLPSSSLPPPSLPRSDRHRTQSVALASMGQRERERGYGSPSAAGYQRVTTHRSSGGGGAGAGYAPPEATVPISRYSSGSSSSRSQWSSTMQQYPSSNAAADHQLAPLSEPHVPYISSVMSPYPQQMLPSRVMPPLSELDRRGLPVVEEAQPRPKPHVCDQCSAAFSRAHDLKRHVETHKGDRPHKCPTCTKAFSRKDALQRHQSMAQCGVDGQDSY